MKQNSLHIYLLFLFIALFSCEKDIPSESKLNEEHKTIDIPQTTELSGQVKQKISKWLARACNSDEQFKKAIFEGIVNVENGSSNELFLLDFLNRKFENGFVKDAIIRANGINESEYNELFSDIESNLYNLVIDVPDFITWFFHPLYESEGLKYHYHSLPFVFYPDIKQKNSNGKWVGFGQDHIQHPDYSHKDGLVLHEIGERERYQDVIPLFVKHAELNYLLSNSSRSLNKEAFIDRYYGDVTDKGKECIKEIMDEEAEIITLGHNVFEVVNILDIKEKTSFCDQQLPPLPPPPPPTPNEICLNGIDDDGDGIIDEEDCINNMEIDCGNELDDDGDGMIDGDDPDCDCTCLRDCQQDHNYLLRHTFDHITDYYIVTSENIPGVEKMIDLRYDITRLNAPACPPNTVNCPFTTNHKMVAKRATMLVCDGYTNQIPIQEYNTLCISDPVAWSINPSDGFFYGYITDNYTSATSGDYVTFATINGLYAVIIGTNAWIREKSYYLPAAGDGNNSDWDASIYGSLIRVNISELDGDQISTSNQSTQTYTFSTQFESNVGIKIAQPLPGVTGGTVDNTANFKYGFNNGNNRGVVHTFSIQAAHLVQLGDIDLIYCDDNDVFHQGNNTFPNPQSYNVIDEQSGILSCWDVIVQE